MRRCLGGLLIGAACAATVACGGGSPIPGEPGQVDSPVEVTTTGGETSGATTTGTTRERTRTSESKPPGVPGSPIDYDSTVLPAGARGARNSVLRELEEACGPGRCGVTVVIAGDGECAARIAPDPVSPGGTVTVTATACETTEESTADSSSAEETTESSG